MAPMAVPSYMREVDGLGLVVRHGVIRAGAGVARPEHAPLGVRHALDDGAPGTCRRLAVPVDEEVERAGVLRRAPGLELVLVLGPACRR
jgi:hypothetical protein